MAKFFCLLSPVSCLLYSEFYLLYIIRILTQKVEEIPKKIKISGSEAIMLSLINEGVSTIFGYPGGAIMPIYDALYGYREELNHVLVRHEQGAAHAAQGYSRVNGEVQCAVLRFVARKRNERNTSGVCRLARRSDAGESPGWRDPGREDSGRRVAERANVFAENAGRGRAAL